jgi:hypothetical protein
MNSPYGRGIEAWMEKAFAAAQAGATVVTLVPVRASSGWWHRFVLRTGAEVRYVEGRLTFGDAKNTAAFASAVVIYRPTDVVGAPGPVFSMPAHPGEHHPARGIPENYETSPAPSTTAQPADPDEPSSTPTRPALDCINRRTHTAHQFEHLFDRRGRVETADPSPASRGRAAIRPEEPPMHHRTATARHDTAQATASSDSRLDALTTRTVAALFPPHGTPAFTGMDPTRCLALARSTVAAHGGLGRSYRHEAAVQHLFGTVWSYASHFAPRAGWQLVTADPGAAQLLWRPDDPTLPAVLDVLTTTGHRGLPPRPEHRDTVLRLCNLTDRSQSLFALPDSNTSLPWSADADPMHARELVAA